VVIVVELTWHFWFGLLYGMSARDEEDVFIINGGLLMHLLLAHFLKEGLSIDRWFCLYLACNGRLSWGRSILRYNLWNICPFKRHLLGHVSFLFEEVLG
jgi:hypothetical protein